MHSITARDMQDSQVEIENLLFQRKRSRESRTTEGARNLRNRIRNNDDNTLVKLDLHFYFAARANWFI